HRVGELHGVYVGRAFTQRLEVEGGDAPDASVGRADGDADPVVANGSRPVGALDAGVFQRQLRRARQEQRGPVEVPDALRSDEGCRRELGDLSGQPAPTGSWVEEGQRTKTGGSSREAAPERLPPGPA